MAAIAYPPNSPHHPHRALVNCVYLWGLRLSRASNGQIFKDQEEAIGGRIDRYLQVQPSNSGSDLEKALQIVQAEVLLATYLFSCGRALEGGYHVNAAVSMATMYGMHCLVPQGGSSVQGTRTTSTNTTVDQERVRVFWQVFFLDRCWAIANNSPALMRDDGQLRIAIRTPWPTESGSYESSNVNIYLNCFHRADCILKQFPISTNPPQGAHTIQDFLAGEQVGGTSAQALICKAVLWAEQAARLASQRTSGEDTE